MNFRTAWWISFAVLVALALVAGWSGQLGRGRGKAYGILIDDRERVSLNRLQFMTWTVLVLSTFLAVLASHYPDLGAAPGIPVELLGLMGISVSTGIFAGAVKDGKNETRSWMIGGGPTFRVKSDADAALARARGAGTNAMAQAQAAAANLLALAQPAAANLMVQAHATAMGVLDRAQAAVDAERPAAVNPNFFQLFLEEEGSAANKVVNITKFQNFVFTLALSITFCVLSFRANGYPTFDERTLWLLGLSYGGYVGGKVPDKS